MLLLTSVIVTFHWRHVTGASAIRFLGTDARDHRQWGCVRRLETGLQVTGIFARPDTIGFRYC